MTTINDYTRLAQRIREGTQPRPAAQVLVDWLGEHISTTYLIMPQGLLTSAAHTPRPDVIRWLKDPSNWRGLETPRRAETALFVPLQYGGRVQGVLALQASEDMDTGVILLVQVLAARLDELHTAHLTHRTRQLLTRINQAETVKEVLQTTVESLPKLLNCQAAVVYKFEPDDVSGEVIAEHPTRVAVGRSLGINNYDNFRALFSNQQVLHYRGGRSDITTSEMRVAMRTGSYQQMMSAPMYAGGRLMGSLSVLLDVSSDMREFSGREGELLYMMAQGVGSAYLNARYMAGTIKELDDALFRQVIDRTTVAVDICDPDGNVIYRNTSWNILFRQEHDTAPVRFDDRLLPEERYLATDVILPGATRSHGWTNYVTLQRTDGSTFDAHLSVMALRDRRERVVGYSAIIDDVTELHHIMDALQKQTARLSAASSVTRAIIDNRGLNSLLQTVLSLIATRFNLHRVFLLRLTEDKTGFICEMACDDEGHILSDLTGESYPLQDDSVIQQVLKTGKTAMIADANARDVLQTTPFAETGSEMVLLLHSEDRSPGILAIQRPQTDAFDIDDVDVMQSIVDQLVIAIDNARLFEELQERVRDISAMTEISLLVQASFDLDKLAERVYGTVTRVYEYGRFGFAILDESGTQADVTVFDNGTRQQYTEDLTETSLIGQIIQHSVPLFWGNDEEKENTSKYFKIDIEKVAESFIGLPLIARDTCLGAIYVESGRDDMYDVNDLQFMLTLANSAAFAIENMQLLRDTRQRVREMEILNSISRTLAQAFGSDQMWEPLLLEMANLFPAGVPAVTLYDRQANRLYRPMFESESVVMPQMPESFCLAVIDNGMTLHFEDIQQADDRFQALNIEPAVDDVALRAWLGTPLRTRNSESIGVLALQSDTPGSFDDSDISLLNTLAAQVSLALDNARLLTSEQERRRMANSLIDIGRVMTSTLDIDTVLERVLEQLRRVVQYDRTAIMMPVDTSEKTDTIRQMQIRATRGYNDSPTGQIVQVVTGGPPAYICHTRQPLFIPDTAADDSWQNQPDVLSPVDTHTWVGVPLLVQSEVIGLLTVERLSAGAPYRETDMQAVFALARQAAIAVENARLHTESERNLEALKQRARRLSSMHHLALMINSTLEPDDILNRAAALLTDLFDVEHVDIVRMDAESGQAHVVATYPAVAAPHNTLIHQGTTEYDTLTQLLESGRPVQIKQETSQETRVRLLAPMIAGNKALGSIALNSYHPQRVFKPDERETFMTITAQIAMAMHNAELYEQAVESSRLKTEFLANISHELRTPLNAIIGYSELLLSGTYGDLQDKQRDRLERVYQSGNSLLALIDDILALSKIDAGRMALDRLALNPAMLIRDALKSVQARLEDRGLSLVTNFHEPLPSVDVDAQRLRQVMVNLLTNAVKFTHEGQITVTAEALQLHSSVTDPRLPASLDVPPGVWVLMSVQDTGIGIAEAHQRIIFDAFRQVDGSSSREFEGTGLGLAITKRLIQMHDGYLWVESEEGQGSTFYVLLPTDAVLSPVTPGHQPDDSPVTVNGRRANSLILLVNDDEATRQLIETYLQEAGYNVMSTSQPDQSIDLVAEVQPSLVVLDVMLSRKENASLLRRLKTTPETAAIPVVIVSLLEPPPEQRSAKDAVAYLTRPISRVILLETLEQILSDDAGS